MTDLKYFVNLTRKADYYRGKADVLKEFIEAFNKEVKLLSAQLEYGKHLSHNEIIQVVDELQEQMWAYYDFQHDEVKKEIDE
jgi:uncharacterized coiled-coil DUF342 family protein|tara:strand:- start:433 stop:678 length:246 start_codon:yes stop_codon:yes gene_type:complete